jgi:hypothetical protein
MMILFRMRPIRRVKTSLCSSVTPSWSTMEVRRRSWRQARRRSRTLQSSSRWNIILFERLIFLNVSRRNNFISHKICVGCNSSLLLPNNRQNVLFVKDDDESEDEEKENSLPETQNFGRGGRRSAVIEHKLRTGRILNLSLSQSTSSSNITWH